MANTINLNITPLTPLQTDLYTLPSTASRPPLAPPPNKRLRSCLSPARSRPSTPFDERNEPLSGCTSRSTSYGSERSKSVRWEGEVPVTSYFHTWSGDEYDRTPLEAPSAEERACVLPARNSRCMTRTYQCFLSDGTDDVYPTHSPLPSPSPIHESPLSSPALAALDEALTAIHELPYESLEMEDDLDGEECGDAAYDRDDECDDDDDECDEEEEEGGWDECMRRRMMFLQHCRQDAADRQPQFDGYRSISATIVDVLRSAGCDQQSPDADADVGVEAMVSAENLKLVDSRPPMTPSLTSASTSTSEGSSEAETLVNLDVLPPASPDMEHLEIKLTLDDVENELAPLSVSVTPTPLHSHLQ